MVLSWVKSNLSPVLEKLLTVAVDTTVNNILSTLPLTVPVTTGISFLEFIYRGDMSIDFHLVDAPEFGPETGEFPQNGASFLISNPQDCPAATCPRLRKPWIFLIFKAKFSWLPWNRWHVRTGYHWFCCQFCKLGEFQQRYWLMVILNFQEASLWR